MSVGNKTFLKHHFNDVCLPEYLYTLYKCYFKNKFQSILRHRKKGFHLNVDIHVIKVNVYRYDVII